MPRDWAQELLRSLPLPDAARAQLWESAYDDDWDTFTQKLTATVQPKSDRDARLLSAKLSRANEARMTLNQQAMMEAPAPQRQGMLDQAADVAFGSLLPRFGLPSPAAVAGQVAEYIRSNIAGDASREASLEQASAREARVMARARQGIATPEELSQLDEAMSASRQNVGGRAALAAAASAPVLTAGVMAESATSPFGVLTAGMGAAPATAVRTAPAAALAAGRTAVKAGTALGVQQSLQNARQAFTSGTPEEQIMAAADIASTGLGFAGMAAQGRYGATPVQDVPKAVAQQVRAAGQARQQQRQATRNMKADIKLFGDIKVIAPAGGAALSISPDDSMRVRRVMSQGATALGLTPDTLPVDRDGYVLLADIVRQGADETYRPLGEVGDQLKAQFDAAEQNLQIAQRNVLAGAGSPAQVVQAERLVRQLANDAFVTIDRTQFNTMLRQKLKESPGAVREAMAYLDSIGDPLNPDAPPSFDSMTVRQALDRLRYVNALELQSGDLQTQNLSQKQRVNADTAALSTYKGLLLEQIGAKLKGAGVDASDRLQDGAVATKLAKRLERNDPDRLAEAQGEIKTLPQRLAEGASAAVPVVAGTAVGAGLGALTGEVVGGAAMGAGLSSALYGRTAGRQIGRDVAQSAAGRTRADVAQTMVRSILNEAPVPGAPVPSLVPVPPATLVTGAPPVPTTPQVPSRAVQIARAVQTPPPMQVAAEVSGGGATAAPVVRYRVINGLTGQVVKTFADVGGQGQATADAYARQQSRSPQYAQEFRDILEGFSGSDADLQQYIAQMLGRPLPPTSPPATPAPPPSSPPSGPVAGGGPAAPMPPPVPQRAPERPKPIEFSFERGPAAPMPPPGGTSAAMSAAPETGPAPAAMGAAPEAVASKPSLPPETSGSSAAFTQPSTAATGAFTLPQDLAKSSPRYGAATLTFASDYDRAAYILANDERNRLRGQPPSKAADKFKAALEAQGYAVPDVVRHGRAVIQAVKDAAGGGAAPQEAMRLTIQPVAIGATPPTAAPETAPVVSSSAPFASAPQPSPSPDTAPLGAPETAAAPLPDKPAPPVAEPAPQPQAPAAEAPATAPVDTPAEASEQVRKEVTRIINTEGAKTGAEVQRRVIATLQEELARVRSQISAYDMEWLQDTKSSQLVVSPKGQDSDKFLLAVDGDGNVIGRNGQYLKVKNQEALSLPADTAYSKHKDTRITPAPVDSTRQNIEAAAAQYLAGNSGKVTIQIPGDGTFTINQTPFALEEMIRRVSKAGPQAWRLSPEMKAGTAAPSNPRPAVKAAKGADAPGKRVPFNIALSGENVDKFGALVGEFIEMPQAPNHRFVVLRTPNGWGVYEYSTGLLFVGGAETSKAKAVAKAAKTADSMEDFSGRIDEAIKDRPVLNTAFPARREE